MKLEVKRSEWGRTRAQSGRGTEDKVRGKMGNRSAAWLVSVPETTKNTMLLAIKSYTCIFYIEYIIDTYTHTQKKAL